jgi:hypothetical protein
MPLVMVNPVLKKLKIAKCNREIAYLLKKHIGESRSQAICEDAYKKLQERINDDYIKSLSEYIYKAITSLDSSEDIDWCAIVICIANALESIDTNSQL